MTRALRRLVVCCGVFGTSCAALLGADFDDKHLREPRATDLSIDVVEGTTHNTAQFPVHDPNHEIVSYRLEKDPTLGIVTLPDPTSGLFQYAAPATRTGLDSFRFQALRGSTSSPLSGSVGVRVLPSALLTLSPDQFPQPENAGRAGTGIDVDGDTVILGTERGAAYVGTRGVDGTWLLKQQLSPPTDAPPHAGFGWSVAVSGDYALVGAWGGSFDGAPSVAGSAYFFKRGDDGIFRQYGEPVTGDPGNADDHFGWKVALDGDWAAIGAHGDATRGFVAGAVYTFALRDGAWHREAKIIPSDGAEGDSFGFELTLDESTLAVSAPVAAKGAGAVYVFERGKLEASSKLVPNGPFASTYHVVAVALSGNYLLCGAPEARYTETGPATGVAYLYERDERGIFARAPLVLDPGATQNFGYRVGISGGLLAASMWTDKAVGTVFIYRQDGNTWVQYRAITQDHADFLGSSVTVDGSTVAMGATYDDSAYFLNVPKAGAD